MGLYLSLYILLWNREPYPIESQRSTSIKGPSPVSQNHRMIIKVVRNLCHLVQPPWQSVTVTGCLGWCPGGFWRSTRISTSSLSNMYHYSVTLKVTKFSWCFLPLSPVEPSSNVWSFDRWAAVLEKCLGKAWRAVTGGWQELCDCKGTSKRVQQGRGLSAWILSGGLCFMGLQDRWPSRYLRCLDNSAQVDGRERGEAAGKHSLQ